MRIIILFFLLGLAFFNCAWNSESGYEVVSDTETVVRTSLEATQVLQSDTLGLFYGENRFGGAVNYASIDAGGTLSFRNVVSSPEAVKFKNNQMMAWLTSTGVTKRIGVSSDNKFVLPVSLDATGYDAKVQSLDAVNVGVSNIYAHNSSVVSIDSAEYRKSGTPGATGVYTRRDEKCFTVQSPVSSDDNVPIYSPSQAITVTGVYCRVQGGTSAEIQINDGTASLESVVCTAAGAADDGSIANGSFTANERMEYDTLDVTGSVEWLNVCIRVSSDSCVLRHIGGLVTSDGCN